MKKHIFILPFLWLAAACASMPSMPMMPLGQNQAIAKDQVHAENRVMKKNLELALRENEVLKTENAQYKSHVKELDDTISTLNADIKSLNAKYDEDTTRMGEEIVRLNESYDILVTNFTQAEQESSRKISELTQQTTGLEKQLADETARLNGIIKDQKASFDAQIETAGEALAAAKTECASREKDLQNQLSELNQKFTEKDTAFKALESSRQEDLKKAVALKKTIDEQTEKIKQMEKAHQEQLTTLQDLKKTILEKQSIIDQLSRKPDPVPASAAPSPTDPKPVKQPN